MKIFEQTSSSDSILELASKYLQEAESLDQDDPRKAELERRAEELIQRAEEFSNNAQQYANKYSKM